MTIGRFIHELFPDRPKKRRRLVGRLENVYEFPSLEECRAAFARHLKVDAALLFGDEEEEAIE